MATNLLANLAQKVIFESRPPDALRIDARGESFIELQAVDFLKLLVEASWRPRPQEPWGHRGPLCSKPEPHPAGCGQDTLEVFALAMLKPEAAQTKIRFADEFSQHGNVCRILVVAPPRKFLPHWRTNFNR